MAGITVTAANMGCGANSIFRRVTAGETLSHGQTMYPQSNGKYYKGDANLSDDAARVEGVAFCAGVADGQVLMIVAGELKFGAGVLVKGTTYVVSATGGEICPLGDLGSGSRVTILGVASDTSTLPLDIRASGVTI